MGVNVDNQLRDSFQYLLLPSVILASIVSLLCLRNFSLSMIVFFAAVGASACSIAIVPLFGVKFGGLMAIIPALVYILTTSGSIHLIRYSLEAIGDSKKLLSIGWRPCVVSGITTAIGMLSLGRSGFPAIRSFGFFCATGAMFALIYQLIAIPWLLQRFGGKGQRALAGHADESRIWLAISNGILRFKPFIVCVGIVLMVACSAGLFRLTARVAVEKLFDPNSPIIASLADLDRRIGPMDQSELMVVFEDVSAENFHSRASLVYRIQRHLSKMPEVGAVHSLHSYLPREPKISNLMSVAKQVFYRDLLDRERNELSKGRLLNVDADSETWRISLRFPFTADNDVEQQKAMIISAATKVVDEFRKDEKTQRKSPLHVSSTPVKTICFTARN